MDKKYFGNESLLKDILEIIDSINTGMNQKYKVSILNHKSEFELKDTRPMYYHIEMNTYGENNNIISIDKYMLHIIYDPFIVSSFYGKLSEEDFNKIYSFYTSNKNSD